MKKILFMLTVLALTAGMAAAQNLPNGTSMSFWGQTAFMPLEYRINQNEPDGLDPWDNFTTAIGPGWGMRTNGAISVAFRGNTSNIGFAAEINLDETLRIGENAYIWARPFGRWMRLDAGIFVENEHRGSGNLGSLDFGEFNMVGDFSRDLIFNRFSSVSDNNDTAAALIRVFPVRGLTIAAYMSVRGSDFEAAPINASGPGLRNTLDRIQFMVGYRIPEVGLARVQFLNAPEFTFTGLPSGENLYGGKWITSQWGEYNSVCYYNEFKRVELAFKLTAVKDLNLDIGFKIPFPESKDGINYSAPFLAALTAGYKMGDFLIDLNLAGWFSGAIDGPGRDIPFAPRIVAHLYPQFNLGFAILAGLLSIDWKDVEIINGSIAKNSDNLDIGFGAFMVKKFTNGEIKGGVTYTIPDATNRLNNYRTIGWLRIPIVMEIYFW